MRTDDDQIIEPVGYDFGFSRRTFVAALGAGIVIAANGLPSFAQQQRDARRESAPVPLDARLHIGKDGVVTVLTGKVECGQGARAELTQAAAEELRIGIEKIRLVMADTQLTPDDGITAGSRTTPSTLPAIRQACAAARKLRDDLTAKTGTPASYADLAAEENQLLLKQPPSGEVVVTPVKEWKVLGTPLPRPNGRDIVTGAHQYPYDIARPGMLYGKILRPPSYGAKLTSIDFAPVRMMNGVITIRDGDFVGVCAPTTYEAIRALKAISESAKWEPASHPPSSALYEHLRKHADVPANPFKDKVSKSLKSHRASYNVAYAQHAPMEPRSAVAEWKSGNLTVWTSTQNPFGVRRELAAAFHISEEKVRVIVPDFGGGFGGKHTGETPVEAARLAQAAKKPVSLQWTREEEFTWATFRPAAVIDIEASLSASGAIETWQHININAGPSALESPYVGESETKFIQSQPPLRHGSYRALAGTANNFARENFIDELAELLGEDPLEFRLANLKDDRVRAVLEEAAKHFKWAERRAKKSKTSGIGLACGADKGSVVAACVEISIDEDEKLIAVRHVCQAFECGAITNPENLRAQNSGAIIQGLGPALREAMAFEAGKILNASFWKYQVPRLKDVPTIEVHTINRPDLPPAGAGEIPLIAIAPAIANAVFHATGKRLRELPLKM